MCGAATACSSSPSTDRRCFSCVRSRTSSPPRSTGGRPPFRCRRAAAMPPRSPRSIARRGRGGYDGKVDVLQPTVLWRLCHAKGQHARAVLLPGTPQVTLTFFVDNVMDRAENFDSMDIALYRSEAVKHSLMSVGWEEDS